MYILDFSKLADRSHRCSADTNHLAIHFVIPFKIHFTIHFAVHLVIHFAQRELFLSEVNNRVTIAAIEVNNHTYCLQKRIEKFPLIYFKIHFAIHFTIHPAIHFANHLRAKMCHYFSVIFFCLRTI